MHTNQTAFNISVAHLRQQRAKSMGSDSEGILFCMYRSPEGRKCAIGPLIPDHMYEPAMENSNVFGLLGQYPQLNDLWIHVDPEMLTELQYIHDWEVVECWEAYFRAMADRFGLQLEEPNNG